MSISGFVHNLGKFVTGAPVKVEAKVVSLVGQDLANKFAHDALLVLKTDAGNLAVEAVDKAQSVDGSNEEKSEAALDSLLADTKKAGIGITESFAKLLIELAVQAAIKKAFGPAV